MVSTVDICNRGLQKLGERKITSLDDDVKAARECKRAFELVRDAVFRDHPWNSLLARASLAALSEAPAWGFGHQYQLPADCLRVLSVDGRSEWRVEGRRILTDAGAPLNILYVRQETDPMLYDLLLVEALASRLAAELAEPLTQSNTKKEFAERQYLDVLSRARRADAQESSARTLTRSSWLEARD
ncbi:MAG: hypothetical protein MJE12_28905 [Alphaproteobacteria bacterium]|nr:hypothetical protein [Alphaproteobacteria bacterium]